MQRQDVGVLEVGGGLDLDQKPLGANDGSEFRPKHLDGDLASYGLDLLRDVDDPHTAFGQQFSNFVGSHVGSYFDTD